MNRTWLSALLIGFAVSAVAPVTRADDSDWVKYAEEANGNLHFYDPTHVEKRGVLRHVRNGIRYKTSLMGAFSYLRVSEINCSEGTMKVLQSTFFTDEHWERPAMGTDRNEKPAKQIKAGSAEERLAEIVCD